MIWALQESLRIMKEEGIENRYKRHIKVAKAMQAALEEIGFTILAEEGAVVAGGLGAYAGKMFRLGHMGNIDTHDLISTMSAIERTLYRLGKKDILGKGITILTKELNK